MERVPMRDGYGKALLELCRLHDDVLVLDADVAKSTRTEWIRHEYPEKYINVGISEQDLVGTAAGLSLTGFVPFVSTYGVFLTGRAWGQIRNTVCYNNLNVKLGGPMPAFPSALTALRIKLWKISPLCGSSRI